MIQLSVSGGPKAASSNTQPARRHSLTRSLSLSSMGLPTGGNVRLRDLEELLGPVIAAAGIDADPAVANVKLSAKLSILISCSHS